MFKVPGGMWVDIRLGDMVYSALSSIGITSERVERWVGMPCGCEQRRQKLNRLGAWVKRVLSGKVEDASKHLDDMLDEDHPENSS